MRRQGSSGSRSRTLVNYTSGVLVLSILEKEGGVLGLNVQKKKDKTLEKQNVDISVKESSLPLSYNLFLLLFILNI